MSQYEEAFKVINSLKEELHRLKRIEQEYRRLKREYDALLEQVEHEEKRGLTVRPEEGFYFCTDDGVYTQYSALNFEEFYDALKKTPLKSVELHIGRGDFGKWLTFIGMPDLAKEFENIKALNISGESLRLKLIEATDKATKK